MKSIKSAGVIGAGVIGSGWIARLILNGIDVCVFDPSKDAPKSVEKVINNETIISASVDVDEFKDSLIKDLNNKEFEIFKSLASGEDLLTIAEKLNISYKTAANYQTSIKQKLNVKNILDFYNLAKENKIL